MLASLQKTDVTTNAPATRGRALLAVLGAAALCWTAGQGVLPDMGLEFPERYDSVAGARGRESLATVLLFLAGCLYVVAAGVLARMPLSRTGAAGTLLLGLGGVWLCAGRAAFNLQMLKATELDRDAGITFLEASGGPSFAAFLPTLLALLLSGVLLGIAARGSGRAGWLPLGLWVLGIGVFVATEFSVKPLEVMGIATANCGLVLAARAVVSGPPRVLESN